MTGILIFTAGREDAYEDYKTSVRNGYPLSELEPHLSADEFDAISDIYEDDRVRLWGTSAEGKWRSVDQGDIALVYRDQTYIARTQVVHTTENLELARSLWDLERNPWDPNNPWRYLTFVTDLEEIDVTVEDFNGMVGYDSGYIPQGFTRVADYRIEALLEEWETVETALAELTGAGEKKHQIEEEDTTEELDQFVDELVAASEDGSRGEEFEALVAEAFTRLGFEATWIEGGADSDVEITEPITAVVEAKSRSNRSGVAQLPAARIDNHRKKRGADYGFAVARHFPQSSVTDAEDTGLTTITAENLAELLDLRERYGIPPEVVADLLTKPGAVQDDRLDELREYARDAVGAMETVLLVLRALDRSPDSVESVSDIRMILFGMERDVPSESEIEYAVHFLEHPSLGLIRTTDEGYELMTDYENAVTRLKRLNATIEEAAFEAPEATSE